MRETGPDGLADQPGSRLASEHFATAQSNYVQFGKHKYARRHSGIDVDFSLQPAAAP